MNKAYCVLVIFTIIISVTPLVSAQISFGEPAEHKSIKIVIDENGQVHVFDEIRKSTKIVQVEAIEGTVSNVRVTDIKGNDIEYGTVGSGKITGFTIFPSNTDVLVEYDLADVLLLKDNLWAWDFYNVETTTIIFPEGVDLVFVNDRPILLHDTKGITCYGRSHNSICDAYIEYGINEPTNIEKIQWDNRNFNVGVRTFADVSSFNFDQPTKSISFDVNGERQLITVIIPLELLWNPYEVYFGDQKILKHEFFSNGTHAWLNIRPENSGTIHIIGTSVIPEFPLFVPFFLGISAVILIQLRNRFNLH